MKKIHYSLTQDDFRLQRDEFLELLRLKGGEDKFRRVLASLASMLFWGSLFGVYAAAAPWNFSDSSKNNVALLMFSILLASLVFLAYWARSGKYLEFLKRFSGDFHFGMHEHGLHIWNDKGRKYLPWHELKAIHATGNNIFFQYGPHQALYLPVRVFQDEQEKIDFLAEIKSRWLNDPANSHKAALPESFQPATSLLATEIKALLLNLGSALNLVFFLRVEARSFRSSYWQAWMLCLAGFAISLAGDYILSRPEPIFSPFGFLTFFSYVLFGLLASLLVSIRLGAKEMVLPVFVVMASADVWINAFMYSINIAASLDAQGWAAGRLGSLDWAVYLLLAVWWLLVVARVLGLLFHLPTPSAVHYSSLMLMVSLVVPLYLPEQNLFFAGRDRDEDSYRPRYNVEDVYYKQGELMNRALSAIDPGTPEKAELYLLAFAGYGDEKVFTNEVNFVKDEFDKSHGTKGRSLVLGNNPETVESRPLANIHNLNRALADMAGKMNVEEDVLFLFLTSHGSEESGLGVEMWDMGMKDIDPKTLRKALDDSGIKNRVVVVSACYSGHFIEPLKDPNTLVISASAKDRTSFGCGDKTEFTYFGEAYFKHALVKQPSFVEAFDVALQEIRQREKAEGIKASDPQIFVGSDIREKLTRLNRGS